MIAEELSAPLWPEIEKLAEALRARHPTRAIPAVLFYGSCLRDRAHQDRVVDFYAVVESYSAYYRGRPLARLANRLLPPSVYYLECESATGERLRAKVAVVSRGDFKRLTSPRAFTPYLWGRFAQPVVLVGETKDEMRDEIAEALATAATTLQRSVLPLMPSEAFSAEALWTRALAESYRTEIRAESRDRAREIVAANASRYARQTAAAVEEGRLALEALGEGRYRITERRGGGTKLKWFGRRLLGRILHVLRLVKGAYTYADGLDYILWKIARHSGVELRPSTWQRRHPILAAPFLLFQLWRRGAFRKR